MACLHIAAIVPSKFFRLELPPPGSYGLPMQISRSSDGDADILHLAGEIDLHASPTLRAELQDLAAKKTGLLLVDFTGVDYIDSSGLATLIEYVRLAAAFGGKIALYGLKPKVRTIFDLVRLGELFAIAGSAEEAREAALNRGQ